MAPHTMAGLRRAAVLAATLALLGTGIAPAYAADPTPDLIPPASTTEPDPSASDVPVGLLAKMGFQRRTQAAAWMATHRPGAGWS